MLLVSAIHAIQRKQQSNTYVCLTQAWPGRESDASARHVLSKRNIRDINTNLPCENTKIDIWYNSNL